MIPDKMLMLMVDTGQEICAHTPRCHPPIPWAQILAYALINGHVVEINATVRMAAR